MINRIKKWWKKKKAPQQPLATSRPDRLDETRQTLKKLSKKKSRVPRTHQSLNAFWQSVQKKQWTTILPVLLIILTLYLAAELTSRIIALYIPSEPFSPPALSRPALEGNTASADYNEILRRNMFNFEGTIPKPFETGLLDCMSQAKKSNRNVRLLGTIVMENKNHSTALIQEEGSPEKIAVKKGDSFFNQYTAMSIDRQRICFQVRSTGGFEFVDIPQKDGGSLSTASGRNSGQITTKEDGTISIKRSFLESKISNLDEILKTARAVPYVRNGKFEGFLVQSVDKDSVFAELGVGQGDILTGVNEIVLDNPGKGLSAFQQLRNSDEFKLQMIRNGNKETLSYEIK